MQNQPSWGQRSESFSLILGFPSQRRESTPRRRFFALALARIFAGAHWVMFSPKRLRPVAPLPAAASHSMWWVRTGGWCLFRWALGPASDGGSGQWELGALVGVTTVLSDPLVQCTVGHVGRVGFAMASTTMVPPTVAVAPSPLRMVELCL